MKKKIIMIIAVLMIALIGISSLAVTVLAADSLTVYEQLMQAESIEEFYVIMCQTEENKDAVFAFTLEQLGALRSYAEALPYTDESLRTDLMDTFELLAADELGDVSTYAAVEWNTTDIKKTTFTEDTTVNLSAGDHNLKGEIKVNENVTVTITCSGNATLTRTYVNSDANGNDMFDVDGTLIIKTTNGGKITIDANGAALKLTDGVVFRVGKNNKLSNTVKSALRLTNVVIKNADYSATDYNNNGAAIVTRGNGWYDFNESTGEYDTLSDTLHSQVDIILTNCVIDSCRSAHGPAVLLAQKTVGTFTINNTLIKNCVATGAHFKSGEKRGSGLGGIIRTEGTCGINLEMNKCVMYNNYSGYLEADPDTMVAYKSGSGYGACYGGAVYWNASGQTADADVAAKCIINDCQFIKNYANRQGGAIFNEAAMEIGSDPDNNNTKRDTWILTEAEINNNDLSKLNTLKGTLFDQNEAPGFEGSTNSYGGAISVVSYKGGTAKKNKLPVVLSLGDGVYFKGNHAAHGGAVSMYIDKSDKKEKNSTFTIDIDGAVFLNNTAEEGGAVYLNLLHGEYQAFTKIVSGKLSGNVATKKGGVVYVNNVDVTIGKEGKSTDLEMSGNKAEYGSAIYLENSAFATPEGAAESTQNVTMWGGRIFGNKATLDGTIYIDEGDMIMHGGSLGVDGEASNEADDGGGVYVYLGKFTINGGVIENCKAIGRPGVSTDGKDEDEKKDIERGNGGGIDVFGENKTTEYVVINGGEIKNNASTHYGGGVFVHLGSITMTGGSLSGNTSRKGGGAYVEEGNFNMSGGTILNCNATYGDADGFDSHGGGAYVWRGNFNMTGGTLQGNTAKGRGGAMYIYAGDFEMSAGASITGCIAGTDGGAIYVRVDNDGKIKGNVIINGGSIENCIARGDDERSLTGNGGAIYIGGGDFTMKNGTIQECEAYGYGGGIYVSRCVDIKIDVYGTVVINGGTIKDCEATTQYGGGIYLAGDPNKKTTEYVKVTGGTFEGNVAVGGGAISVKDGTVTVTNGVFENNHTGSVGGAVFVNQGGLVCIDSSFDNNTSGNGGALAVDGGDITIKGVNSRITIKNCSATNPPSITPDTLAAGFGHGGAVLVRGGNLEIINADILLCTAESGGGFYIYGTDAIKSVVTLTNVTLDGCKAIAGNGGGIYVFDGVVGATNVTVSNCTAQGNGDPDMGNGGGIYVGSITEGSQTENLTVNGGTFNGNSAQKGGAIDVKNGNATIKNASFSENQSIIIGGAVYVNGGRLDCSDSRFERNHSANGGALAVNKGTLELYGTSTSITDCYVIEDNNVNDPGHGGAISVSAGSAEVSDITISGCHAIYGGAIAVHGGNIELIGVTIELCWAREQGGGFYIFGLDDDDGVVTMTDTTVSGCYAQTGNGGGAFISYGTLNMHSGEFSYNESPTLGGGVAVEGGHMTMYHGAITYNQAASGAGVYIQGGDFTMYSGALTNNGKLSGTTYGGGAYVAGGSIVIGRVGCELEAPWYDAIYGHQEGSDYHHPEIQNNESKYGGGLAISNGNITLYCTKVLSNMAQSPAYGYNIFVTDGHYTQHTEGTEIGEETNPGIVVIGGTMDIKTDNVSAAIVDLIYHANDGTSEVWEAELVDGYYLNLPFCLDEWIKAQEAKGLVFVGWSPSAQASDIRAKDDYKAIGEPFMIRGLDDNRVELWAIWRPKTNTITYKYSFNVNDKGIDDDIVEIEKLFADLPTGFDFSELGQSITIGAPRPLIGYTFIGWRCYANPDAISNWDKDCVDADGKPIDPSLIGSLDPNIYDLITEIPEQTFGNIVMVAVYEPAVKGTVKVDDGEIFQNFAGANATNAVSDRKWSAQFTIDPATTLTDEEQFEDLINYCSIIFKENLPENTKLLLTWLDNPDGAPRYYYYSVSEADGNSIPLVSFKALGMETALNLGAAIRGADNAKHFILTVDYTYADVEAGNIEIEFGYQPDYMDAPVDETPATITLTKANETGTITESGSGVTAALPNNGLYQENNYVYAVIAALEGGAKLPYGIAPKLGNVTGKPIGGDMILFVIGDYSTSNLAINAQISGLPEGYTFKWSLVLLEEEKRVSVLKQLSP